MKTLQEYISENDIELIFAGDAMQHSPQYMNAKINDYDYNYSKCFSLLQKNIKHADYAVVNLECTLGGKPYSTYPYFSAPEDYAIALKNAGFNLFTTANNHALDRNDLGGKRTIDILDTLGISHIGTYYNYDNKNLLTPFIKKIKNINFAFLNYTYSTNNIKASDDFYVNYINKNQIKQDIDKAKQYKADIIIVILHWGNEYEIYPAKEQKELAEFLIDNNVDIIIGGHPHVIQPFEFITNNKTKKSHLIIYSLGNFISNQKKINSRGGAIVSIKIDNNKKIKNIKYNLFFVQKPTMEKNYFQLIPVERPDLVLPDSKNEFYKFKQQAEKIIYKK